MLGYIELAARMTNTWSAGAIRQSNSIQLKFALVAVNSFPIHESSLRLDRMVSFFLFEAHLSKMAGHTTIPRSIFFSCLKLQKFQSRRIVSTGPGTKTGKRTRTRMKVWTRSHGGGQWWGHGSDRSSGAIDTGTITGGPVEMNFILSFD